ncbi:MAG: prepilin-type N-terminal cleavage/methylation domain-containing protein [Cyanobacteria bacterium]|nr:prepilin-type N-terminal cleavage/methylation domain-containing protein [Cyanobacteriota bacterium]
MPARLRSHPQNGFNLVELLITLAVLSVVLASFTRIMGTEAKLSTQTGRNLAIQDSLSQASDLMRREIAMASRVSTNASDLTLPSNSTCKTLPAPKLVLIGPNNAWQISYGLNLKTDSPSDLVNDWFGPGRLIRCGPPYSASGGPTGKGGLNTGTGGTIAKTVVLDRLIDNSTAFSVSTGTGRGVNQSTSITLKLQNDQGTQISSSFQTSITANSIYDTPNYPGVSCPPTDSYKCNDGTDERDNYVIPSSLTTALTITGDQSKEVAVYLPSVYSPSAFSGTCTTTTCTIGKFTLKDVSLLIFTDKEIRPTLKKSGFP